MSGHVGIDALGWDDRSVRSGEAGSGLLRTVVGPSSVISLPGWKDALVAGEAAALAGAGRIAECGTRAALLRNAPDTEAGRALWPAHLRWLAGEAQRAVLAIPDCAEWNEARRQALIDAGRRARLDPTLLWRSVATLLGLPAGTLAVPVRGAEAIVVSLTASETTISCLGLEVDNETGLLTPLRRRFGQLVSGSIARGLDVAERAAQELARRLDAASAAEPMLWSTRAVADILAGRRAAAPGLLLADGRWLVEPIAPIDVTSLGQRLVEAVRRALEALEADSCMAVVVEGPFAACPAPGGSVGSSVLEAAAKRFPGAAYHLAQPEAVATGAAEHARRLALGLPTYFDFLPQIQIAAYVDGEPDFVDLIKGVLRIAGNQPYDKWVNGDFAIAAGTAAAPFYIALEGDPTVRSLSVEFKLPPAMDVPVRLHVTQRPAQGHARVEIVPSDAGHRLALGRGQIVLDWSRLEGTGLDRAQVRERLQVGYGYPDQPAYLPAHRALWDVPVRLGGKTTTAHALLHQFVANGDDPGLPVHIRRFLTHKREPAKLPGGPWAGTGKRGPLDSDGKPPAGLAQGTDRLLEQARATIGQRLERAAPNSTVWKELVLLGAWFYLAAPPQVVAAFRERLRAGMLPRSLAQAAGRCLADPDDLRALYRLLQRAAATDNGLHHMEIKAIAESLQWRPDAARALEASTAAAFTSAAVGAMQQHRMAGNFGLHYHWAQQLLIVLLRFRILDGRYLAPNAEAWAPLRRIALAEAKTCLRAVAEAAAAAHGAAARRLEDMSQNLRDYLRQLDSRANDTGLIVRGDPDAHDA